MDAKTVRGGRNLGAPFRQTGLHYATIHHRAGAVDKVDKRIIEDYRRNGMSIIEQMQQELQELKESSNLRTLPDLIHEGRDVIANGQRMLNLSSND